MRPLISEFDSRLAVEAAEHVPTTQQQPAGAPYSDAVWLAGCGALVVLSIAAVAFFAFGACVLHDWLMVRRCSKARGQ